MTARVRESLQWPPALQLAPLSCPAGITRANELLDDLPGAFEVENDVRSELHQVVQRQYLGIRLRRLLGGQQENGILVSQQMDDRRRPREPERQHREYAVTPHFEIAAPLGTQLIEPLDETGDARPFRRHEPP
ncbi:hypothetical protein ACGFKZ_14140 [Micromonospora tulbaghiae]|uniref:hypothetical protein n=1 Tax=Micromonospora tulbaghiae TaxID=479978 RepID=UPI003724850E